VGAAPFGGFMGGLYHKKEESNIAFVIYTEKASSR